jgi:hypothetical protein
MGWKMPPSVSQTRDTVVRHANCPGLFRVLLRANRSLVLALLWAALAACIAGSLAFDVIDWVKAWHMSFDMPTSGTAI